MKEKNFDRAKDITEVLAACIIISIVFIILPYKMYKNRYTENKVYIELMRESKTKRCEKGYESTKICFYSNYECIERKSFSSPAYLDFSCKNLTTNEYIYFNKYV
jgi:hypothetical protein